MKVKDVIRMLNALNNPNAEVILNRPFNVECGPGESMALKAITCYTPDTDTVHFIGKEYDG